MSRRWLRVSTAQEDHEQCAALHVKPDNRTLIDLHIADAGLEDTVVAAVPGFESVNARLDTQPRLAIGQTFEPVHESPGRPDDHHV